MKGPEVPIFVTASGTRLAPDAVWTGSKEDGSSAVEDCREWTSAKFDAFGWYGDTRPDAGGQWSSVDKRKCDMPSHLYCFER